MAGSERIGFQREGSRAQQVAGGPGSNAVSGPVLERRHQLSRSGTGPGGSHRRRREPHSESVLVQRGTDFSYARRRRGGSEAPRASGRKMTWPRPAKQKSRIRKK